MAYARQTLYPAQEADQRRVAAALNELGWTRRQLADQLNVNMYAVWRAQNGRVRAGELDAWDRFLADPGQPSCDDRVRRALTVLDRADRARSVTTLREVVADARAILEEQK